jgi:hypothetical protein
MTGQQRGFQIHAACWFAVNAFLFLVWAVTTPGGFPWFVFPAGGWGIGLAAHAAAVYTRPHQDDEIEAAEEQHQLGY